MVRGVLSKKLRCHWRISRYRVNALDLRSTTCFRCLSRRRSAKADRFWLASSSLIDNDQSERGKPDRRFCLWIDRFRRLHLRKANEPLEADAPWNRVDGLPVLH